MLNHRYSTTTARAFADFPYDGQDLSICLTAKIPSFLPDGEGKQRLLSLQAASPTTTGLRSTGSPAGDNHVTLFNFSNANVFEFSPTVHTWFGDVEDSGSGIKHPHFVFRMGVRRKSEYFEWNITLPMMIITGLALGSFSVDRLSPGDRLAVSLTMVLTAVAFKLQIAADLPNLAYLTFLDAFVLFSFCFISACSVENMVVAFDDYVTQDVDRICAWVFFGIYVLYVVFSLGCSYRRKRHSWERMEAFTQGSSSALLPNGEFTMNPHQLAEFSQALQRKLGRPTKLNQIKPE